MIDFMLGSRFYVRLKDKLESDNGEHRQVKKFLLG